MREISLHILDLVQNSISADCSLIKISILENTVSDSMNIIIEDDGCGMDEKFLESVRSPFTTTRTTRDVGLGISLFDALCIRSDGELKIDSKLGVGTSLQGIIKRSHMDKPPIGRINETLSTLLLYDDVNFEYLHRFDEKEFSLKSLEIREMVGADVNSPAIINWIKEYIDEHLDNIGVDIWN